MVPHGLDAAVPLLSGHWRLCLKSARVDHDLFEVLKAHWQAVHHQNANPLLTVSKGEPAERQPPISEKATV